MPKSNRFKKSNKTNIHWGKLEHVQVTMNEKETELILKVKPTDHPFPRVTIITELTNIALFQFALYSWSNLNYPVDCLNWIIVDNHNRLDASVIPNKNRINVIKYNGKHNDLIKHVMDLKWISTENDEKEPFYKCEQPCEHAELIKQENRTHVYTELECGDILYPDSLSVKYRTMIQYKKDCVCPDSLAYYNPYVNSSIVLKLFAEFPRSGLYWKKSWWNMKNSDKVVGLPYIGNCISIGQPTILGSPQLSSIRFFENFSVPIKRMLLSLRKIWMESIDLPDTQNLPKQTSLP